MKLDEIIKEKIYNKTLQNRLDFLAKKNLRFVVFINSCEWKIQIFLGPAKKTIAPIKIYNLHMKQVNQKKKQQQKAKK